MLIKLKSNDIEKSEKDNGITLVALVITVIIIIILATITLNFTFGENGIITKANQAKYMAELSSFKEELGMWQMGKSMEYEDFEAGTVVAGENSLTYAIGDKEVMEGNIYDVIQSLRNSDFAGKLEVIGGELLLNSTDKVEIEVAKSLDIRVNPYLIVDGVLLSAETNLALMDESGVLTLPESVEKIGNGAFANLSGLKTIIIPGTVKEIGRDAFRNNADIERVVLQEGIEIIGTSAFYSCKKLTTINLPNSLTDIKFQAFMECDVLDNISIPNQITTINDFTFYGCDNLTNLKLSDNLQIINSAAFANCEKLNNIYLPINLKDIVYNSFDNCINLVNIEIAKENTKYTYSKENGMLLDKESNEIIFISSSVLNNITTFSIPEGTITFKNDISRYTNIQTIIIPKSLEKINLIDLFPTSISNIEIAEGNTNFVVENECLYNTDKTQLWLCFTKNTEANLANSIINVSEYAFKCAPNLENITFPDSVISIGSQALRDCRKLKNVYIGANASSIDPIFKFNNYSGTVVIDEANPNYSIENNELYNKDKSVLISILHDIQGDYTVKDSVKKIGDRAFHYMSGMTSIILPEGLEEIGASFNSCTGLKEIYIPNSVEKIASDAFNNSYNLMHIRIDKEPNTIEGAPWGAVAWDRAVEWLRPAE